LAAGFCAVAEELAATEGFPTAEQATSYASLAPAAIRGDAEIGDGIYDEHEGDDVALFVAMAAADTVEDAARRVNAFEPAIPDSRNAGIGRDYRMAPRAFCCASAKRERPPEGRGQPPPRRSLRPTTFARAAARLRAHDRGRYGRVRRLRRVPVR